MINLVVMKFEGDKPQLGNYLEVTGNDTVRKVTDGDGSNIIGFRAPTAKHTYLPDDEILVQLINVVPGLNAPLFTSTVDDRGRLTIRKDVRERKGICAGDKVDVFDILKVVDDES